MRRILLLAVLTITGCEKATNPTAVGDCDATIEAMLKDRERDDLHDRLFSVLTARCRDDAWTDGMHRCAAAAKSSFEQWRICSFEHLDKDRADKLDADIMKARKAGKRLAITDLEPMQGDAAGGTYVKLTGSNFIADGPRQAKIYFGSRQGTIVRFQSDSALIAMAPAGKPGDTVDVLVIFEPGGQLEIPKAFTYVERGP
jgi:hypothetical protein